MAREQTRRQEAAYESDSDSGLASGLQPIAPRPWKKGLGLAATAALLVAVGAAGGFALASRPTRVLGGTHDVVMAEAMPITPPRQECSNVSANCMSTGCCKVTGFTCFKTEQPGVAKCMKKCEGCTPVDAHQVAISEFPGLSFFCFSVYTKNSGSAKQSHELELLQEQKARGVSIFRCAEHAVYSDVEVNIAPGYSTIKLHDVKGDWHFAKRKTGAWVNTGMFFQVWKKIGEQGLWTRHNYVVKADPDAVFFSNKLFEALRGKGVPAQGLYYENCKYVDYGLFGNLEVISKAAFGTLLANMDSCYTDERINWKLGIQGGKYGPMGEDLFAQSCMDLHGVAKVEKFDLTLDGACPADRPKDQRKNKKYTPPCKGATAAAIHPFKKPEMYFKCLEAADSF